jgi:hypothetical protein
LGNKICRRVLVQVNPHDSARVECDHPCRAVGRQPATQSPVCCVRALSSFRITAKTLIARMYLVLFLSRFIWRYILNSFSYRVQNDWVISDEFGRMWKVACCMRSEVYNICQWLDSYNDLIILFCRLNSEEQYAQMWGRYNIYLWEINFTWIGFNWRKVLSRIQWLDTGFGLVNGFIGLLQTITTIDYSTIANSCGSVAEALCYKPEGYWLPHISSWPQFLAIDS